MNNDEKDKSKVIGGRARAAALTPAERKDIARKGAIARWGYQATHRGNFKEDFGIDVDCYVLNDQNKTAVISQRGMGSDPSLVRAGEVCQDLLAARLSQKRWGRSCLKKIANPLIFKDDTMVLNMGQPIRQWLRCHYLNRHL